MKDTLLAVVPWALPPVLGAIIGYVTNAIAIKMLFRPFREVRVLGIKVPFTPGIIPKQRYQLAESIGRMVSRELLTEEAIGAQLDSSGFRSGVRRSVEALTSGVLDLPVDELFQRVDSSLRRGTGRIVGEVVSGFLGSETFERLAGTILDRGLRRITSRTVGDLLRGEGAREALCF